MTQVASRTPFPFVSPPKRLSRWMSSQGQQRNSRNLSYYTSLSNNRSCYAASRRLDWRQRSRVAKAVDERSRGISGVSEALVTAFCRCSLLPWPWMGKYVVRLWLTEVISRNLMPHVRNPCFQLVKDAKELLLINCSFMKRVGLAVTWQRKKNGMSKCETTLSTANTEFKIKTNHHL